jgi:hypothetical protein
MHGSKQGAKTDTDEQERNDKRESPIWVMFVASDLVTMKA